MRLLLLLLPVVKHCNGENYTYGSRNFESFLESFDDVSLLALRTEITNETETSSLSHIDNEIKCLSLNINSRNFDTIFRRRKMKNDVYNVIKDFDLVHLHLPAFNGDILVSALKKAKVPYFVKMSACAFDGPWTHSLYGKFIAPFTWLITRRLIKNSPFVFYVTEKFLQKRYPTKGIASHFSNIRLNEVDDSVLENRLNKIKSSGKKLIIGTAAAVHIRLKGQQYVIKALALLKSQGNTDFRYQLAGGGDQSYLKSMAAKYGVTNQIDFLGSLPHEKIFDWLDSIDIYCQPSRAEGLPRAVVEAMSRALPALGARSGGIPEILDDEYIFNNSFREEREIARLLIKLQSQKEQEKQAMRNFNEAKKFEKSVIDTRRKAFFNIVKKNVLRN